MICVETGAWFATFVPNDPNHNAADAYRSSGLLLEKRYRETET
jgi:hypothetical protein